MSLHSYHYSLKISRDDPPFYALIMAAMRKADDDNVLKLRREFPEVWDELRARYNSPMGVLESEREVTDMDVLREQVSHL